MNSVEGVQTLLEAGKIDEALLKVQKALEKNPEDLEIKQAAASVYYRKMKEAHESGNSDKAIEWYGKYYVLQLPEEDTQHEAFKEYQRRIHPEFARMQEANKLSKSGKNLEALAIYEEILKTIKDYKVAYVNVGWCLYRLLAELTPQEDPDVDLVNKCFDIYKRFEILGPSNLHAQMLRIALYFKDVQGVRLLDFLHGWNFEHFREEDYKPFKTSSNTVIPSLCERAFLTYSRVLMKSLDSKDPETVSNAKQYALDFLPQLENVFERLPRNTWLPYVRSLLMAKLGKTQRVQMELVHLLKRENNQFWAWASLAECFAIEGKEQEALASYCKAFLLPTQGELAIHVRESFARLLARIRMYPEAKAEIETIERSRDKKEKVKKKTKRDEYFELAEEDWYKSELIRSTGNNKMLYTRFAGRADALLWADVPEQIAIVTHVDTERGLFFFAVDRKIGGKHGVKGLLSRVKVGDILALKLREEIKNDLKGWKVVGSRYEKEKIPKDICQILDETIQIPYGRDFGFFKPSNIYVGPDIVKKYRLYDGQRIKGLALQSYNKAKAEWGWKVISIMEDNN